MWENKMDEKMYKSMKYIDCYCDKHAKVLVGMKAYPYINIVAALGVLIFLISFLPSNIPLIAKIVIIIVFGLVCLLPLSLYKDGKKMMLKAGHTMHCSKKVGFLVMLYAGALSPFAIMKEKKEK